MKPSGSGDKILKWKRKKSRVIAHSEVKVFLILIFSIQMKKALSIIFLCFVLVGLAQDKPKLGLVLSGGGAKGAAHIGILKAMEEAGLRPDYITGTSMGAVVGGLYALGYSADEIEQIMLSVDWSLVLSNQVPLNYISFEEKEYYNRYLVEFPMKGAELQLPSGLIEGQVLGELLRHYLWSAREYHHFDDFPIPFRCIATNVKTGEPIIFEQGDLATAIRSSMALPTAFTAVELDSTLAVDGGVLDNFPVEQVVTMGADYVIGVNVGTREGEETPEDMIGILMSLAMIKSTKILSSEIAKCDILVEPEFGAYSTGSFSKVPEIVEIGRQTGKAHAKEFRALAEKMGMNRTPFNRSGRVEPVQIHAIKLSGNTHFSDALILSKLGFLEGDTLHREELEEGIRRVYGINGFKKVDYDIVNKYNQNILEVQMEEKLPSRLFASVHLDNIFAAGILLNYTARDLLGPESRLVTVLDISRNPRFRFDYYKYIGNNKRYALNLRYDFLNAELPSYDKGVAQDVLSETIHNIEMNALSTQSLKQSILFGFGYQFRQSRSKFNITLPEGVGRQNEEVLTLRLVYLRNDLNNRNFPTEGGEMLFNIHAILSPNYQVVFNANVDSIDIPFQDPDFTIRISEEEVNDLITSITPDAYLQSLVKVTYFFPITRKMQFIPYGSVGLTLGTHAASNITQGWVFGGYQRVRFQDTPILGLQYAEIEKPNFGAVGFKFQNVFMNQFYFKYGANLYGYYDHVPLDDIKNNFDWGTFTNDQLGLGYGAELTWRTRLGPVSGGVSSNTQDGYYRFYFAFGFSFNYSD